MTTPQWANTELSSKLDEWIDAGESAELEFKVELPENRRKLAQEIAAMATSGGGHVLIGVSDEGSAVGLPLNDGGKRDEYFEQVQGIVDTIRPAVDAELNYAVLQSLTILVISIDKQSHPVFYVEQKPYIRDGRRSRAARPEEVVNCVWAHPSSEHKRELERLEALQIENSNRLHTQQMENIAAIGKKTRDSFLS